VNYQVTGQWTGGFQGAVTIRNTGSTPINGWRLGWTFPNGQRVTQAWGGGITQSGAEVTATNVDWNGSIAPGGTATLGFLADWTGSNAKPPTFVLNGASCTTV
jgi:cellulase/cellobiase CelA1